MTNITMITLGSRGDVQPYVALGKGLKQAGYSVTLLASDDFERLITEAGLTFVSAGESTEKILQSEEWRKRTERGNFLVIQAQMRQEIVSRAPYLASQLAQACHSAHVIIGGIGLMAGGLSVAEKLGVPVIDAHVFPATPTRYFPSPLTPHLPFGRWLNRFSHIVSREILWQSVRLLDVATRQHLGLSPSPFWSPYKSLQHQKAFTVYGYSRHVLPKPPDWNENTHVVGYWTLTEADTWQPPEALVNFLQSGKPPVYVGFGSMVNQNPEATARLVIDALQRTGQRGIIASGWGGLSAKDYPDTIYQIGSVPHAWLFPQLSAVVHHGGAGTTSAGLRAGVPSVIVPFMGDQPFWGARIQALGVGTKPIPRRDLTADTLVQAIQQAVSDAQIKERARVLGEKIRAETGIESTIALIEKALTKQNKPSPTRREAV